MVSSTKNLYEILDVEYDASFEEIKAAYKKLVRIYHPDVNKSKTAEINFKILNNAYEVLSDIKKRENYDNLLKLSGIKIKRREIITTPEIQKEPLHKKAEYKSEQGQDDINFQDAIIKEIKITENEAKTGCMRTVNILNKQICPKCHGKKFINGVYCAFCQGDGEKKEYKKIETVIKAGVKDEDYIPVGKINSSAVIDKNLFLKIKIEPYKKLFFENNNVIVHIELSYEDLILGCKKEIAIPEKGLAEVVIPSMTKPDTRIKLDIEENRNINYYALIKLNFPSYISNNDKILYDKIRRARIREV